MNSRNISCTGYSSRTYHEDVFLTVPSMPVQALNRGLVFLKVRKALPDHA